MAAGQSEKWAPDYAKWRHGGWYVSNVIYPSGACGCVSNNYVDKKWRIVCDPRRSELGEPGDFTFRTRDAAAIAERQLAKEAHEKLSPWLGSIKDPQLYYSAVSLFKDIDRHPDKDFEELFEKTLRLRSVDASVLRSVGESYRRRTVSIACGIA